MDERGEIAIGLVLVLTVALCGWVGTYKDVKYDKKVQELTAQVEVIESSD